MRQLPARVGARLISATRVVDRAFRRFDQLRSEFVLAFATERMLDEYNNIAYGHDASYRPSSDGFRGYLFPWEERVIDQFFPPPPARLLIGGAGGGREVFPLLERGYEVTAFEPSRSLAEEMLARVDAAANLSVFCAGYEDLPFLKRVGHNTVTSLAELPRFDAAVIGWGSFSHLRHRTHRLTALRHFASATKGPIVASFLHFRADAHALSPKQAFFRRVLKGPMNQDAGNAFSTYIGFYHEMNADEMIRLADEVGLRVAFLSVDTRDTNWPHVVLVAKSD